MPVDATIDPTENVKALSEASAKRQDDLREAQDRLTDEKISRLRDIVTLSNSACAGDPRP